MSSIYDGADYELAWPRDLFVREAIALLNYQGTDWRGHCGLLLEDAFVGLAPRNDFRQVARRPLSFNSSLGFLSQLVDNAAELREATTAQAQRRPYWSERRSGSPGTQASLQTAVRQFIDTVNQLEDRGYFENAFSKGCVEDPCEIDPSSLIEQAIGVPGLWPLEADCLAQNTDTFYDVVEVLHDLVARPRTRRAYDHAGRCWHYGGFSPETGRVLYRWRVNALLDRSDLGLRLADEGEDIGRLVAVADPARADLLRTMAAREDTTGDQVRHAIKLYRGRQADEHDKRSAVVALYGVLEERRRLIKAELLSKDENDLFMIANNFAIRHQNEQQKHDYSVEFLDWIFWWYLATIELTDRLLAR